MANNDPTKWKYFEDMDTKVFLQMVLYYKEKQEDIRQQHELAKARR